MFILSSIPSGLRFWSVNHASFYKNSKLKSFKNIQFLSEISGNWLSDLLGINVYKTLQHYW